MPALKDLIEQQNKLTRENRELLDLADKSQEGVLSKEQEEVYEKRDAEIDNLTTQIDTVMKGQKRREKLNSLADQSKDLVGRQSSPSAPANPLKESPSSTQPQRLSISRQDLVFPPGTQEHLRSSAEYGLTFNRYLRSGKPDGLADFESLGMKVADNTRGGYLVPMTFVSKMVKFLDDSVFMRGLSTVYPNVAATGMGAVSWDADPGDADWTAEVLASDASEDDTARVGKRELIPKDLTKLVLSSTKMLNANGTLDVETWLAQRLAYKFAISEEKAFLTGNGAEKPLGVFTADSAGISTGRDVSCAAGHTTTFDADDVIDVFFSLKEAYMRNATWLVSRAWVKLARKMKASSSGVYIWSPAGVGGTPSTIMDRPYVMSEYVPNTYAASQYIALVGDFKTGYWIADNLDMTVTRLDEVFRLKKQIGFLGEKSTDGMPVLEEAFARMKLAAA